MRLIISTIRTRRTSTVGSLAVTLLVIALPNRAHAQNRADSVAVSRAIVEAALSRAGVIAKRPVQSLIAIPLDDASRPPARARGGDVRPPSNWIAQHAPTGLIEKHEMGIPVCPTARRDVTEGYALSTTAPRWDGDVVTVDVALLCKWASQRKGSSWQRFYEEVRYELRREGPRWIVVSGTRLRIS